MIFRSCYQISVRLVVLIVVFCLAVVNLSCNDSLPAYNAPTDFLRASARNISPPDVFYSYVEFYNDVDKNPVNISSAPQTLFIDVVNTFDETLQDFPDVSGTLELTDPDVPNLIATIPLSVANLTGIQYNSTTRLLTLNPGDTLKLRCSWRYKGDDGKWVFGKSNVVSENIGDGVSDVVHAPMTFAATAKLKLFASTNTVTSKEMRFQLVFHGHLVQPP